MNKKIKRDYDGLIYSTNSDEELEGAFEEIETPVPHHQKLIIRLETKQRGGKKATMVKGFIGKKEDLESLAKKIKSHCGTGGSLIDGEILIQGDMTQKVKLYLRLLGYTTNNI